MHTHIIPKYKHKTSASFKRRLRRFRADYKKSEGVLEEILRVKSKKLCQAKRTKPYFKITVI